MLLREVVQPKVVLSVTNKRKYAVQHNTSMSYHKVLHVAVCINHQHALLIKTV